MAEKDEDLKMTEAEDGSLIVGDPPAKEEEPEADEKLATSDETHEDEAGHAEESAEDAEARRQRNRERRAHNKESRKNYIDSLKRELASRDAVINDLSTRVASVEQRNVGNQMTQVDAAIKEAEQYYAHFKSVNQQAIEQANGAAAVDAQEKMFAAQQRYQMLQNTKKQMGQQATKPAPLDPRLKQHADDWISKNDWYDPSGQDMDSDIVLKLDDRLVKEGWNPTTSEYWEELDARVKKYLPHRANSGYNKPQGNTVSRPRVPVAGSNQDSGGGTKGSYRLSAERVQALKEAGTYDDPVKRADAIKRFQAYDKEHSSASADTR
jgi:hypothetical protein